MDIADYRRLQQKLLLPLTGHIPANPLKSIREQDSALSRIARTWRLVEQYSSTGSQQSGPLTAIDTEIWIALRRWFASHHLFIPQLALTGACLEEVVRASHLRLHEEAGYWMRLASRLRKGCGTLFLFGVDFSPCAEIYCEAIRKNMPVAFSGFWIRERQHCFQPALKQFASTCPSSASDPSCNELRKEWASAEHRYHELHEQSMFMAVPDGISLARTYRHETGKGHAITEEEFRCYDTWFSLDRSQDLTRLDYIFQVCDVIERVVSDLAAGHRLESEVLRQLLDGAKASMVVFGQWAGPVSETSSFYPKCLRGE
jgi:hypothetical protein